MRYVLRRAVVLLLCMCFVFSSVVTFDMSATALPLNDSSAFSVTIEIVKEWVGPEIDEVVNYTISYTQDNAPKPTVLKVPVTKADDWRKVVTGLPKYNADGTEIAYTVTEDPSDTQKEKYYTHLIQGQSVTDRTFNGYQTSYNNFSSGRTGRYVIIPSNDESKCLGVNDMTVRYDTIDLHNPIEGIGENALWDVLPLGNRRFRLRNVQTRISMLPYDFELRGTTYPPMAELKYFSSTTPSTSTHFRYCYLREVATEHTSMSYTFKSQLKTKKDILKHTKTITYLKDKESNKNPDTDVRGEDLYRLYLDVAGPAPIDLLLVLDRSSSMLEGLDGTEGVPLKDSKYWKVMEVLNGTNGETGAIEEFFKENAKNRLAIIDFGGRTKKIEDGTTPVPITSAQGYTYTYDTKPITTTDGGKTIAWQEKAFKLVQGTPDPAERKFQFEINSGDATNYSAAFKMASRAFEELDELDKLAPDPKPDHRKMMVFLSDGAPTFYIDVNGNRFGIGNYTEGNLDSCISGAKISFDEFCENRPDVTSHSLGFSDDPNTKEQFNEILEYIASKREDSKFEPASNNAEIRKYLRNLTLVKSMKISDSLSENVALYDTPDYVVTMKNKDGSDLVVLYDDKDGLTAENGTAPNNILVEDPISEGTDSTTKRPTVTLNFNENYKIPTDKIFTISFNVKVTEEAYKKRVDNMVNGRYEGDKNYPERGDEDTDYLVDNNDTSSGKPGFYSNDHAEITYIYADENNNIKEPYRMPVVQTSKVKLTIKKVAEDGTTPLPGAKFKLYSVSLDNTTTPRPETVITTTGEAVTGTTGDDGTVTIGDDGTVTYENLLPGYYAIEEVAPPDGYKTLGGKVYFYLYRDTIKLDNSATPVSELFGFVVEDADESNPAIVTVKNERIPYTLKVTKNKEAGGVLPGAGFRVYDDETCGRLSQIYTDSTMKTLQTDGEYLTTDEYGILRFYGMYRGKTYYVKEVYTPTGYTILEEPVKIEIKGDGTVRVTNLNVQPLEEVDGNVDTTDEGSPNAPVISITVTDRAFVDEIPETGFPGIVGMLIGSLTVLTAIFAAFVIAYKKRLIKQ